MIRETNYFNKVDFYNVVDFFMEQHAKTPSAPAIQFEYKILSYDEFNHATNRLANFLIEKRIGKNQLVGLSIERSLQLGIGVLGILKSGAAYVPFDPELPADRISDILQLAKCDLIITSKKNESIFINSNSEVIVWEDVIEQINQKSSDDPKVAISENDLLYIIFTSGSTGTPKGVAMRHGPLVNLMHWQKNHNILVEPANTLQYCSINFDVSFQEMLTCWSTGGCLHMIDDAMRYNPLSLLKFIAAYKIERLFLVFSALQQLCEVAIENSIYPESLKDIITGGEQVQITPQLLTFFEKIPECVLHNHYGPTETNVVTTYTFEGHPSQWPFLPPIGKPIDNELIYILNENLKPVAQGEEGELYVGGVCLAKGYLHRDDLTKTHFIRDPFSDQMSARMYKTGDMIKELHDGNLQFIGRKDGQVKLRGYRIELAEIEHAISLCDNFKQVVASVREDYPGLKRLVAYIIKGDDSKININEIRKKISIKLPDYMIPGAFVFVKEFPLSANGKIDRQNLPLPELKRPEISTTYIAPVTILEKDIEKIWNELLLIDKTGVNDNFFDLGGNSLLAVQFVSIYYKSSGVDIPVVKLYEYSTIKDLCDYLQNNQTSLNLREAAIERTVMAGTRQSHKNKTIEDGIAIIGMSGRFPGAKNIDELWNNLVNGVESTSFFKPEELDPFVDDESKDDPNYVAARGIIADADMFDAGFFGMNPKVAEVTDPQQRIFLELAWEAIENAGYAAEAHRGLVGIYAGAGYNSYYANNVLARKDVVKKMGSFQSILSNEKDYIATLASYMLNLKGPAMSIHTACSTSLVAVIEAVKSLREFECDMALAGGISITAPIKSGHIYSEGSLFSKDGHTRSFSDDAAGTTFSDGGGIVVLKRYRDAIKDGDQVYAVVRGIGLNNDGHDKASFAAPSVHGQAAVIAMAQADAGIEAETISYIEAHGTATPIGDPIEIEALTTAFRSQTQEKQFCAIGSIKSNFGHLTAAAGVAGLIKTVLSLNHKLIPPTINFSKPNPAIDFANSPFYVNTKASEWKTIKYPRRAGISSFGLGGTNAHVILEELPQINRPEIDALTPQLLVLSAKTKEALEQTTINLIQYLKNKQVNASLSLSDVAYTLQTGRKSFDHKKIIIASHIYEALQLLQLKDSKKCFAKINEVNAPAVLMIFTDGDFSKSGMALNLYKTEKVFSDAANQCCDLLKPLLKSDLKDILFNAKFNTEGSNEFSEHNINKMPAAQFILNYAAAKLFISAGVMPKTVAGSGTGKIVAACIAGVITLEMALKLCLQVDQSNPLAASYSNEGLVNLIKSIPFHKPIIPILAVNSSNVVGLSQLSETAYWVNDADSESNINDFIKNFTSQNPHDLMLLCGPVNNDSLIQQIENNKSETILSLFHDEDKDNSERFSFLKVLGKLWLNDVAINWQKIDSKESRMKIALPAYPFQRKRYWIDPPSTNASTYRHVDSVMPLNTQQFNNTDQSTIQQVQNASNQISDETSLEDQNMMFAIMLQQMQMQQQLLTMMILENNPVLDFGNASSPVN